MIGILCAMPQELEAVATRLGFNGAPKTHGSTRIWRGRRGGTDLALALSGIGKVNAAAAATVLLSAYGARSLVFSGVAGGLDPALPVGAVLLADRLAIHDYGLMSAGRLTPTTSGVIPVGAPRLEALAPVSPDVAAVMARLALTLEGKVAGPIRLGGVTTADYFLNCAQTRAELHEGLGADAIDMESGAVAQVAAAWGAPLYVIRTLSDLAGEDSHLTIVQMVHLASANSAVCVEALLDILES